MAITLVSAGALASSTGASVTPAFGKPTTAGSLLVCCAISGTNTAFSISGPSGWVNVNAVGGTGRRAEMWQKANCAAGETAPTVNCAGATLMTAQVVEAWGALSVAPLDVSGTANNAFVSSLSVSTSGPLAGGGGSGGISVFVALNLAPTSGAWVPGAGWTGLADDFASLVTVHFASDVTIGNPPPQAVLTELGSVTGFAPAGLSGIVAAFLPAEVPISYGRGAN